MEKPKQEYIRKIKLKLEQPPIMCHGRKSVGCFYKAKVFFENEEELHLTFKSHGKEVTLCYDKEEKRFYHYGMWDLAPEWSDLKVIE